MAAVTFIGRERELDELLHLLGQVRRGRRADAGIAVALRGRRRVGKSRLVTELIRRAGVPAVYFQAVRGARPHDEYRQIAEAIAASSLPGAHLAQDTQPTTLTAALNLLAAALPGDEPSIAVIDEIPWLLESEQGAAGELQRVWDRTLATKPVLLLLIGSDLGMMEELTAVDQPFHGRPTPMLLDVLSPRDIARMTGLAPFDAFDAALITGGLPMVTQEWEPGMSRTDFLRDAFARPTSALVVSGARVLDAEFPEATSARAVLTAIGGRGERTFTRIQAAIAGGSLSPTRLSASLDLLSEKRVVVADDPLSTRTATKDRRWRIADPALRFWLAFVQPALGEIDRGRPDLALERAHAGYESWRGRAIEPVVRAALSRLLPDDAWPETREIGGWWPRNNTPEIDLVGADRRPARSISFVGAIKWRDSGSMTGAEVDALARDALKVPGVTEQTELIAVTGRRRATDPRVAQCWNAADLLEAWP